jgi:hypothetical protein
VGKDALDQSIPSIGGYGAAFRLAYGTQLIDNLSVGIALQRLQQTIDDVTAAGWSVGGGLFYQPLKALSLGASFDHLGSDVRFIEQEDPLPRTFRIGGAYAYKKYFTLIVEGVEKREAGWNGHVGFEFPNDQGYAFRTGYNPKLRQERTGLAGFTTGFGLRISGHDIAYSWLPQADLGSVHLVTVVVRWGRVEVYNIDDTSHIKNEDLDSDFQLMKDFAP